VKAEPPSPDGDSRFFHTRVRIKTGCRARQGNFTWYCPTQLGAFDIECTVIWRRQSRRHAVQAIVVPVPEFKKWYFGDERRPMPEGTGASSTGGGTVNSSAAGPIGEAFVASRATRWTASEMFGPSLRGYTAGE